MRLLLRVLLCLTSASGYLFGFAKNETSLEILVQYPIGSAKESSLIAISKSKEDYSFRKQYIQKPISLLVKSREAQLLEQKLPTIDGYTHPAINAQPLTKSSSLSVAEQGGILGSVAGNFFFKFPSIGKSRANHLYLDCSITPLSGFIMEPQTLSFAVYSRLRQGPMKWEVRAVVSPTGQWPVPRSSWDVLGLFSNSDDSIKEITLLAVAIPDNKFETAILDADISVIGPVPAGNTLIMRFYPVNSIGGVGGLTNAFDRLTDLIIKGTVQPLRLCMEPSSVTATSKKNQEL